MADLKKKKSFRREREQEIRMKKVKKERGKEKFCQKRETAAKIGHLLRLEQRTRQTAQTNDRQLSGASQTRSNENKTREKERLDMHDSSCAWESTIEALFSEENTSAESG